eukprot:3943485-Prymnesium_polylepis.1
MATVLEGLQAHNMELRGALDEAQAEVQAEVQANTAAGEAHAADWKKKAADLKKKVDQVEEEAREMRSQLRAQEEVRAHAPGTQRGQDGWGEGPLDRTKGGRIC